MLRNTFGTELKTVEQFVSEFNQITGEEYSLEQILKEFKRLRWVDKNFNITSTGYNRKIIDYKEKILISEYGRKLFVSNYDKRKREAQLDVSKSKEIDNSPF